MQIYADQDYVKRSYFFSPLRLRQPHKARPLSPLCTGLVGGIGGINPQCGLMCTVHSALMRPLQTSSFGACCRAALVALERIARKRHKKPAA